jgi:hypothetical protein
VGPAREVNVQLIRHALLAGHGFDLLTPDAQSPKSDLMSEFRHFPCIFLGLAENSLFHPNAPEFGIEK